MSFQLFDNMKNFILKVFLCLLPQALENPGWIKLAPKFEDFPTPTAIFKDFQGACEAEPCPTLMFVLFTFSLPPPSLTTVPCSATPYKYKGPTRAWGSVKHGSQLRNHSVLFCQLSGGSRHSDKGGGEGGFESGHPDPQISHVWLAIFAVCNFSYLLFVILVIWKQLIYYLLYKTPNTYACTYAWSQKRFFSDLWASIWSKNRGGGPPGPLPQIRHCCITKVSVPFEEQMKSSIALQIEALNLFHIHQFY